MRSIVLRGNFAVGNRVLILGFYALFLLSYIYAQVGRVQNVPIPSEYDEHQHVSFILSMKANAELFPRYENLRLIDLQNPSEFTDEANYLNHSSVYYILLSVFASGETSDSIFKRLRLVNLGLSTLALSLLFSFGMSHLREPREHLGFGIVGVMCPTVAALGGQVSNDNMALLGGVVALIGLTRLAQGRITMGTAAIIGLGFAIAALAKLTAGLLVGICTVAVHGWMLGAFRQHDCRRIRYFSVMAIFVVVGTLPYLHNLTVYHAPLYLDRSWLHRGSETLGFGEFLAWFAYAIPATWSLFPPANAIQMITLASVLGFAGYGIRYHLRSRAGGRRDLAIVSAAGGVAVIIVMPIHFGFSYDLHLETGHHGGPHIRYYLPMWSAVMLGVALGLSALGSEARKATALLLLMVFMTYSNLVSARENSIAEIFDRLCLPVFECDTQ